MVKRFHEKAGKYQKAVCAAISIFAFVCIWQMAVAFTKAGLVLAGPIETLGAFFTAILHPYHRGTYSLEPGQGVDRVCLRLFGRNGAGYPDGVV